jgi:uncharacterized pyridoxal phosphate-containing UPF0001 family protein
MGMASNTDDEVVITQEFQTLNHLFTEIKTQYFISNERFTELSMGMSSDYKIALKHGATLIRIGSLLFGSR